MKKPVAAAPAAEKIFSEADLDDIFGRLYYAQESQLREEEAAAAGCACLHASFDCCWIHGCAGYDELQDCENPNCPGPSLVGTGRRKMWEIEEYQN